MSIEALWIEAGLIMDSPWSWISIAQGEMPAMDAAYWLALASRVIHLLCAAVLLGGIFYLRMVVAPGVTAGGDDPAERLFSGRRATWAKWVGIVSLFVLITGGYNYFLVIRGYEVASTYHMLLGIKILIALLVLFLAAALAGRSPAAVRFREKASTWLGVCLLAAVVIFLLGGVVRTIPHVPLDPTAAEQPDTPSE